MAEDEPLSDDDLAAEYVLGVLDSDLRGEVSQRIEQDRAFAARVAFWEEHLADLNTHYEETPPPARIKAAIDRELFPERTSGTRLWRWWPQLVGGALAALLLVWAVSLRDAPVSLQAQLLADGSDYVFTAEVSDGQLQVALASGDLPTDRSLELWQIVGDAAPVSLGVLGNAQEIPPVPFAEGQVVAITLEPLGGSPTGEPTGPIVALGELKKVIES